MTPRPRSEQGRVKSAGDSALLLELEPVIDPDVNARVIGIAERLQAQALRGVRDVVPTYRSVAVHFDPLVADVEAVRESLARAADASYVAPGPRRTIDVPVSYGGEDGPDLDDVAAFGRITPQQVIERHAAASYRVFMLGFLPGFPYMGTVPPEIAAPRRATPRTRVPRGSVGIAGAQTGIYPTESPGGWQIVGRTALPLFDPVRTPPALFAPGDHVRFIPVADAASSGPPDGGPCTTAWEPVSPGAKRTVTVLRPGLFTTIQDAGRWGYQAQGVPVGGVMDSIAHRAANLLVGNDPGAAVLEATLLGPELRLEQDATVAVTGADLSATIDAEPMALDRATPVRSGATIRFGARRSGARAYIAVDGGIDVPPLLGSRSTHVRGGLGRALAAGDRVPLGTSGTPPARLRHVPDTPLARLRHVPDAGARVRVMAGPQDDWFGPHALDLLQRARFIVSSQSDRMGYRLAGERIPRTDARDMISDATFIGAIQIPPSGEPILLMADRQTTGGYPQIATVITADLPLAAQLAPGDWIQFQLCTRAEALEALAGRERA